MEKNRKIVIYGGSFDPPHKGHFLLLQAAVRELAPDLVYIVPSKTSPFKNPPFASFHERVLLIKKGLADYGSFASSNIKIHPFEFRRRRITYSYQTARFFSKLHPDAELYLLMGTDCLRTFRKWEKYRLLLKIVKLVAGRRKGFDRGIPGDIPCILLKSSFPDIASTSLKSGIFAGDISDVPSAVKREIIGHGLYFTNIHKWLRNNLSAARFKHTLFVTRLALLLASKYRVQQAPAALAALLHDAARDFPEKQLVNYILNNSISVPGRETIITNEPFLLHSYASAELAREIFGVRDKTVLNAIRDHTFGAEKMSDLGKIIYVADIAAEDRSFREARAIRSTAFKDLQKAFLLALTVKMEYTLTTKRWIYPRGLEIWNRIIKKQK